MTFTEAQIDNLITLLYVIVIGGGFAGALWACIYSDEAHEIVDKIIDHCYNLMVMFLRIPHRVVDLWGTILDMIKKKMGL